MVPPFLAAKSKSYTAQMSRKNGSPTDTTCNSARQDFQIYVRSTWHLKFWGSWGKLGVVGGDHKY